MHLAGKNVLLYLLWPQSACCTRPLKTRSAKASPSFFNAFGGIVERDLDVSMTVDSGHLVAWEPSLDYEIKAVGGLKQTLFSGEGLVMELRGRGKVWLQTRTLKETAGWITPYLMS